MASSRRSGPKRVGVGGVLRLLEGDLHVRLRGQVVDLVRLHLLHDVDQRRGVGHVAVVQDEVRRRIVRVFVDVVDARGVEQRGAPLDAVHFVAFGQQKLGEIGAVLTGNSCDKGFLQSGWFSFMSVYLMVGCTAVSADLRCKSDLQITLKLFQHLVLAQMLERHTRAHCRAKLQRRGSIVDQTLEPPREAPSDLRPEPPGRSSSGHPTTCATWVPWSAVAITGRPLESIPVSFDGITRSAAPARCGSR